MSDFLVFSEIIISLLFSIIGFYKFKVLSRGFQYLTLLMFTGGFLDGLGIFLIRSKLMSTNMHFWALYQTLAIILTGLIFYYFARTQIVRNLVIIMSCSLLLSKILFLLFNGIYAFDNIGYGLSHLAWIIFSIAIFFEIFQFADQDNLMKYPLFWIICGFLIYCAGTLFLLLLQNFEIWILHNVILLVKYFLFSKGLWEELKTKSSSASLGA